VALLATLLTLLILLFAVLDLMVRASTAVAQLTLGAVCDGMAHLATIEAPLLARWCVAFLPLARAALFCDVTLLATLATVLIFLGAVITSMVSTATAVA